MKKYIFLPIIGLGIFISLIFLASADIDTAVPDGDITTDWDIPPDPNSHYTEIDEGTTANTGDYIEETDGTAVDEFTMSDVDTGGGSVSSIKIWAYGKAGSGGTEIIEADISLDDGSTWEGYQDLDVGTSFSWKSVEFTGTWSDADIDKLQVRLRGTMAGGINANVAAMYANVTYSTGDTTDPEVNLISPADSSSTSSASQTFTANITDDTLIKNLTLYIWNSTENNIHTNSTTLTGTSNETDWAYTLPYEDTFTWNALGYDDADNSDWADSNFTLTLDITAPQVNIISPKNKTYVYSTKTISINFTLNEGGYCEYSINDGKTNNTMTANSSNTGFNASVTSFSTGSKYTIYAYCNDTLDNSNYTETLIFSVEEDPGDGGGSWEGGSSSEGKIMEKTCQEYENKLNLDYNDNLYYLTFYYINNSASKLRIDLNKKPISIKTETGEILQQSLEVVIVKDRENNIDLSGNKKEDIVINVSEINDREICFTINEPKEKIDFFWIWIIIIIIVVIIIAKDYKE